MADSSRVPRLVSDVWRGYVAVGIYVVWAVVVPFIIVFTTDDIGRDVLIAASLLITFAVFGFAAGILNLMVFSKAESTELRRWLIATTPRRREARIWWYINGGGSASWAIYGSLIAMIAVVLLSADRGLSAEPLIVFAGIATVVGALLITITAYAVGYARQWANEGGLEFAGDEDPRFVDFIYMAVQVSTTFSTSDVTITNSRMRRIVTANSLVSFAFNTVIVALLVSTLVR